MLEWEAIDWLLGIPRTKFTFEPGILNSEWIKEPKFGGKVFVLSGIKPGIWTLTQHYSSKSKFAIFDQELKKEVFLLQAL